MRWRKRYDANDCVIFCPRCYRHLATFTNVRSVDAMEILNERMQALHHCRKGRHER